MELHLDLTKSATRTTLLDELLALMSPEQRTRYDYILNHTTIPDKHHHSIGEVNASIDAMTIDDALTQRERARCLRDLGRGRSERSWLQC